MKFIVWDCLCSEIIATYSLRHWAEKRRRKEIESRHLLENSIAVMEKEDQSGQLFKQHGNHR